MFKNIAYMGQTGQMGQTRGNLPFFIDNLYRRECINIYFFIALIYRQVKLRHVYCEILTSSQTSERTKDGLVHAMRPVEIMGAHVRGFNAHSIGICYEGGLNGEGIKRENYNERSDTDSGA